MRMYILELSNSTYDQHLFMKLAPSPLDSVHIESYQSMLNFCKSQVVPFLIAGHIYDDLNDDVVP